MRRLFIKCSSSKNRYLPVLPALGRAAGRGVEKLCCGQDSMSHNMGLCCMQFGLAGGRGIFSAPGGLLPTKATTCEKFYKMRRNA